MCQEILNRCISTYSIFIDAQEKHQCLVFIPIKKKEKRKKKDDIIHTIILKGLNLNQSAVIFPRWDAPITIDSKYARLHAISDWMKFEISQDTNHLFLILRKWAWQAQLSPLLLVNDSHDSLNYSHHELNLETNHVLQSYHQCRGLKRYKRIQLM